jgi:hypothetical protein
LRKALMRDEAYEVRIEAALTLGRICDVPSLEPLTQLAKQLARGQVDEGSIRLSLAAVTALGQLHPADLAQRLAPIRGDRVPRALAQRIEAELAAAPKCQARAR